MSYTPPYSVTEEMVQTVSEISSLIERITISHSLDGVLTLRRKNRIQTIHSSLAIEQNTLTEEQVTAVINGHFVVAPPEDIKEVQNAYKVYERLDQFDPYSMDDLCTAHGIMTRGLTEESGVFRSGPAGVVRGNEIIHFGTLAPYIPDNMQNLFSWLKESDSHMLIKSSIFHYEFEVIHPFADGNGRTGRFWQTLLLSQWKPVFAWIPVESMIYRNQEAYYQALNQSNGEGEGTPFLRFLLEMILQTLREVERTTSVELPAKLQVRWDRILSYLRDHESIKNAQVQELCGVAPTSANRILTNLCGYGLLQKHGAGKGTFYTL